MSEPIIYFGIGFLLAVSLVFGARPLAHTRVGRLAMQRLETAAPSLMADIEADMGQLHSQIAVATRRLEMSVEQMKQKTTSQLAEIAKTSEAIGRLKAEFAERTATCAHLQERQTAAGSELHTTDAELKAKTSALADVEQTLSDRKAEYAKLMAEYDVHPDLAEAQSRHAAALDALRAEKAVVEAQLKQSQDECAKLQADIGSVRRQVESTWASERMANAVLRERINDVASEVVRVAVALEGLSSPIETLVAGKAATAQAETDAAAAGDNGHGPHPSPSIADNGEGAKSTLVHRIRALRKRASEVSKAS